MTIYDTDEAAELENTANKTESAPEADENDAKAQYLKEIAEKTHL